jgi:hypothetical protein
MPLLRNDQQLSGFDQVDRIAMAGRRHRVGARTAGHALASSRMKASVPPRLTTLKQKIAPYRTIDFSRKIQGRRIRRLVSLRKSGALARSSASAAFPGTNNPTKRNQA